MLAAQPERRNAAELAGQVQRTVEQGAAAPVIVVDGLDEARGRAFMLAEELLLRLAPYAVVIVSTRELRRGETEPSLLDVLTAGTAGLDLDDPAAQHRDARTCAPTSPDGWLVWIRGWIRIRWRSPGRGDVDDGRQRIPARGARRDRRRSRRQRVPGSLSGSSGHPLTRLLRVPRRARTLVSVEIWTIEATGETSSSAQRWKDTHGDLLVEKALAHGAKEWAWVIHSWGVVLQLGFADESDWLRFRATAAVRAALDAAADPANGLLVYAGPDRRDANRMPEPTLATMIVRYLRQWDRWSLRTFLKWSLTGEQGWWLTYQTENTIDRLEWLTYHGLSVRGRSRRGGNCYRLAPGVPLAAVWHAVATGHIAIT
ncbi:MAG: hypothetical protein ACRDOB_10260 [Streptosporangiaceae bacterium]